MTKNRQTAESQKPLEPGDSLPVPAEDQISGDTAVKSGLGRRLVLAGARGTMGLIGVGVAGVSIAAATLVPLPQLGLGPTYTLVTPAAATQQRICAGPVLQLGNDTGQDATTAISVGTTRVTSAATSGTPSLENLTATENPNNTPSQRLLLPPPPPGEANGVLAGSQSQVVATADMTGFAASECTKPSTESWLVGGSTVTGRTTLLSLNNPSQVSSTVKLTIYSENGRMDAAGTEGIVVPPGGRTVLSIAGFAPGLKSPIVHVESTGGQVSATLQQSIVRTLTPGGVDVISASTDPSTLTVIPGVVISGQNSVAAASTVDGFSDLAGVLRVFVPGLGTANVTVTAQPEGDAGDATTSVLQVQGGVVTDFPLGGFTDGTWTFSVSSDQPVIAAARTSTVTLDAHGQVTTPGAETVPPATASISDTDFAWFVGAPQLSKRALVSVATGPSPTLHLQNSSQVDTVVTIDSLSGKPTSLSIPAGKTLAVSVEANTSYSLDGFDALRISVSYLGVGALAGFTVSAPDRAAQAITVFNQFG